MFSHHDTYIELDYRLGKITGPSITKEETCDLEILDVNYQGVGETLCRCTDPVSLFSDDAELLANAARLKALRASVF